MCPNTFIRNRIIDTLEFNILTYLVVVGPEKDGYRQSLFIRCSNVYGASTVSTTDVIVRKKTLKAEDLQSFVDEEEEEEESGNSLTSICKAGTLTNFHAREAFLWT